MKEELKKLVEQSEVPLLKHEIDQLRGSLSTLTNLVLKTEQDLASYRKVTEDLAKELAEHLKVRTSDTTFVNGKGSETYYRDVASVSKRWKEWEEMHKAGKPISEIARKWGVNHHTVRHAKAKNFIATICKIPPRTKQPKDVQLFLGQKRRMRQKPHRVTLAA
jgi:predicted transcriptional regulator